MIRLTLNCKLKPIWKRGYKFDHQNVKVRDGDTRPRGQMDITTRLINLITAVNHEQMGQEE